MLIPRRADTQASNWALRMHCFHLEIWESKAFHSTVRDQSKNSGFRLEALPGERGVHDFPVLPQTPSLQDWLGSPRIMRKYRVCELEKQVLISPHKATASSLVFNKNTLFQKPRPCWSYSIQQALQTSWPVVNAINWGSFLFGLFVFSYSSDFQLSDKSVRLKGLVLYRKANHVTLGF